MNKSLALASWMHATSLSFGSLKIAIRGRVIRIIACGKPSASLWPQASIMEPSVSPLVNMPRDGQCLPAADTVLNKEGICCLTYATVIDKIKLMVITATARKAMTNYGGDAKLS